MRESVKEFGIWQLRGKYGRCSYDQTYVGTSFFGGLIWKEVCAYVGDVWVKWRMLKCVTLNISRKKVVEMVIGELLIDNEGNQVSRNSVSIQKIYEDRCIRIRERMKDYVSDDQFDFIQ